MTTQPQRPEIDFAASTDTISEETVALTRRHSEITKRLTRKQTIRRIDALKALAGKIADKEATV